MKNRKTFSLIYSVCKKEEKTFHLFKKHEAQILKKVCIFCMRNFPHAAFSACVAASAPRERIYKQGSVKTTPLKTSSKTTLHFYYKFPQKYE